MGSQKKAEEGKPPVAERLYRKVILCRDRAWSNVQQLVAVYVALADIYEDATDFDSQQQTYLELLTQLEACWQFFNDADDTNTLFTAVIRCLAKSYNHVGTAEPFESNFPCRSTQARIRTLRKLQFIQHAASLEEAIRNNVIQAAKRDSTTYRYDTRAAMAIREAVRIMFSCYELEGAACEGYEICLFHLASSHKSLGYVTMRVLAQIGLQSQRQASPSTSLDAIVHCRGSNYSCSDCGSNFFAQSLGNSCCGRRLIRTII